MLLAADNGTQIAYIALIGTLTVPVITGMFGVLIANRNRQTSVDTTTKIDRSAQRLDAFEEIYEQLQREKRGRQYFEDRCYRQESTILRQAIQIRELEAASAHTQEDQ